MATLIPETPKECPYGERLVFDRFARDLDPQWIVIHSLGLVEHKNKIWGEIDFVVLSTKGIFVIEVKGGRISCKNGLWTYEAPGKQPYVRKESPWTQAGSAMIALRKKIAEAIPGAGEMLFGYGVVMPHEVFTATGPEIEQETLLDYRNFKRNLGFFIGNLQRHWQDLYKTRHGREYRVPTLADLRAIRHALRPDVESSFRLGSYFNGLDRELIQLTDAQMKAARGAANNARTVVRGRAGTGKTVVAVDRARRLAAEGLNVMYVCFNQLLARHVAHAIQEFPQSERFGVTHIHALFREKISAAGMLHFLEEHRGSQEELFARVFPEVFVDAALAGEIAPVDVLIVDEAQDILTEPNLDALDLLLKDGLRRGRWHLFLDPLQNIYGKESDDAQKRLIEYGFAAYELFENCRNTKPVAVQASIVSGVDLAMDGAIDGPSCECRFFEETADFKIVLEKEISALLESDIDPKDIVILSPRRLENSMLAGTKALAGVSLAELTRDSDVQGVIHYATIQSFKGLERKVVLAIDVENVGAPEFSMLHYAGLSRARLLLRVFLKESERGHYNDQARAFGERVAKGNVH